jgi:aryl-alcohol dehydrogenase-like predicted oxidoreductase
MRLSDAETIATAAAAGVTVFDTARAYADNEALLAAALRRAGAESRARVVTKGGMARVGDRWVPDGRAKTIRSDCEASLAALDGLPIDLYLVHAPDPRTPWATTVRALARLVDEALVRRVGVANVNRRRLDDALALAPIAAVQVALSLVDDAALRGGVLERCVEAGIAVIAHSPLGGPRRAPTLVRNEALAAVAARLGATPAEVALAWLLELAPNVVAIPGARRPETVRSAVRAATLELAEEDREALTRAFDRRASARAVRTRRPAGDGEVVIVMGIPGAGKSRIAEELVARGYVRINRDERGGSLLGVADALDDELAGGTRRVVLDNTYLTRASRSYVVETANRHRLPVRCVWLDTPLAQAQVNLVTRLLDRFGSLPTPEELQDRARREQGLLAPTSQMRAVRELEPPSTDEGFAAVEQREFVRVFEGPAKAGVLVAAAALAQPGWRHSLDAGDRTAPHLVFDWRPDGSARDLDAEVDRLSDVVSGRVEGAVCPHGGGPPRCWCRPPLPGLPLAFARRYGIDLSRSVVIGASPAHLTLARAIGARYVS